jgi:hypothetical protein
MGGTETGPAPDPPRTAEPPSACESRHSVPGGTAQLRGTAAGYSMTESVTEIGVSEWFEIWG